MTGALSDKQRLLHILDAISEIENYTHGIDLIEFKSNSMIRFASIKQLEIIGEAARHLTVNLKEQFSQVTWNEITGLRNILVHEYFGIDPQLIWQIIISDIPELKMHIQNILKLL
jgi:uncharacterized protein with HEPN domain